MYWCRMGHLEGKGQRSKYPNPKTDLYAIEDLESGSGGRVWLVCSSSGALYVLKFKKKEKEKKNKESHSDIIAIESEKWKKGYPEFKVFHENLVQA